MNDDEKQLEQLQHDSQATQQLRDLATRMQAEQQAQTGAEPHDGKAPVHDDTIFGFTLGALALGALMSIVGIGYLRYAKVTSNVLYGVTGVVLMVMPYFVTSTWGLAIGGAGTIGASILVRKYVTF
jgi:hypothetical protein